MIYGINCETKILLKDIILIGIYYVDIIIKRDICFVYEGIALLIDHARYFSAKIAF